MIDSVIFDMDGLMFDTERVWATLWEPALATLGLSYKEGLDVAARGTAGDTMRAVLRRFYGENCDTDAIIEALHAQAEKAFQAPPPKKPGLDEILTWLDAQHIPMAVASSSRMASIRHHLDGWGLTHYFKVIVSGEQFSASKPNPEIFLRAAEALGTAPSRTLVLEDSYNGVRAGAAGGFVTVMVPDMAPANDEMRRLYTAECRDLYEVLEGLRKERFCFFLSSLEFDLIVYGFFIHIRQSVQCNRTFLTRTQRDGEFPGFQDFPVPFYRIGEIVFVEVGKEKFVLNVDRSFRSVEVFEFDILINLAHFNGLRFYFPVGIYDTIDTEISIGGSSGISVITAVSPEFFAFFICLFESLIYPVPYTAALKKIVFFDDIPIILEVS